MKRSNVSFLLTLTALALFLSGASESKKITSPKETEPQSKKTQLDKKEPAQQRTPADLSLSKSQIDKDPPNKQATEKKNQAWQPTDWFTLFLVIFTGCLVGVGIVQVVVYRKQTRYMRQALKITRQATDTASRQTGLIFGHERAWIMVRPKTPINWPLPPEASIGFPLTLTTEWSAINVGKTPAFMRKIVVGLTIIDLPPQQRPEYPIPYPFAQFIIPPGGDHSSITSPVTISQEMYQDIRNGEKWLVFYGFVEYEDTLERLQHITRFCSFWQYINGTPWFQPVGPPDWVEYT